MVTNRLIKTFNQFREGDETSTMAAANGMDEKGGGKTSFTYSGRPDPDNIPTIFQGIESIVEIEQFLFIQFRLLGNRLRSFFSSSAVGFFRFQG